MKNHKPFITDDPIFDNYQTARDDGELSTNFVATFAADGSLEKRSLPAAGAGDMILANVQTVTGAKTFENTKMLLRNVADTFNGKFTNTNTADRTYTLPDKDITVAGTDDIDKRSDFLEFKFSDETTAIDAATGKVWITMPNYATTLTDISAAVTTAPTTSAITIDVNEGTSPVSLLSTKITIDATEYTSEDAATPPVISDSSLAANARISVDVDTADSGGTSTGGSIILYYNKT